MFSRTRRCRLSLESAEPLKSKRLVRWNRGRQIARRNYEQVGTARHHAEHLGVRDFGVGAVYAAKMRPSSVSGVPRRGSTEEGR